MIPHSVQIFLIISLLIRIDRTLYTGTSINSNDPVEKAIEKFKNHPSKIRILQEGYADNNLDLDIQNVINKIDSSKAYQKGIISPQIIKINAGICSMTLVYDINKCINNGVFPDNLKHADITPIFKKTNDFVKQIIDL